MLIVHNGDWRNMSGWERYWAICQAYQRTQIRWGGLEMEKKVEIPSLEYLKGLTEEGVKNFEQTVLEGPLFKEIIRKIEDVALDGLAIYEKKIESDDDVRALKVICTALKENDFYCEIENKEKTGLLMGKYYQKYFVVKWETKKSNGDEKK